MPRHLISDAHEWINEIPTVPIYYLAKPQPRERAWQNQRGKKTLEHLCSLLLNGVDSWRHPLASPGATHLQAASGKVTWNGESALAEIPWRAGGQPRAVVTRAKVPAVEQSMVQGTC